MRRFLLFLSTFFLLAQATRQKRQAIIFGSAPSSSAFDCTTPDNIKGSCIILSSCEPLYSKLRSNSPPPNFIDFLRRSVCRYERNSPVVCCPNVVATATTKPPTFVLSTGASDSAPIQSSPPTQPPTQPATPPPTVSPPQTVQPVTQTGFDLLPKICGKSTTQATRIVGGRIADKEAWPWLAALGYRTFAGKHDFLCGGALITPRHVLTAAHCVHRRNDLEMVRMGEYDLDTTDEVAHEDFKITKKTMHEDYNNANFANDIAILALEKPVSFRSAVGPVCLPTGNFFNGNTLAQISGFVAGWGSIAYNNISSHVLKEAMLPIRRNEECQKKYAVFRTVEIDQKKLCAGIGGNDACQGDSGGPLMIWNPQVESYAVVGVVSVGFRCAEAEFPGIYTRVTEYLDWIKVHLD